ncbi:MAG: hypothetical protein WCI27_09615, partial [Candidatus Omnitrophota bacterium]
KRLLKTLLDGGDSIRVVGTLGDMYIAVPNGFRIETTDDLIGFLLEQKFGGATNRSQFINYLAKIRLTKVLNPKAAQYSIKNEEVMVNRSLLNVN